MLDEQTLHSVSAKIIAYHMSNDIMYILDSNYNLSRLGLWRDKVIWVKITNLSVFDHIKETLDSDYQYLELTATTIACNSKVWSIETGKILFEDSDAKLTITPNMLCSRKEGELTISRNPGSR